MGDCILPSLAAPANGTWPAADRGIFIPFEVWSPIVVVQMAWNNGGTIANTSADVGIYDLAGNRKVHSGSIALAGANAIQIADITDTVLLPGIYLKAMTLTGSGAAASSQLRWSPLTGIAMEMFGLRQQSSIATLPDPCTLAVPSAGFLIPVLTLVLDPNTVI